MDIADILFRAVQRGRERHSPPVVNKALFRWPAPPPAPPGLVVEELEYYVEEGQQGWVPLRIVRPLDERDKLVNTGPGQTADESPAEPAPAAEADQEPPAAPPAAAPPPPEQAAGGLETVTEGDQAPGQPSTSPVRRPVVVFMHATGENMDVLRYKQELYARTGYFTAAIDARYHGQRAAIPYEVGLALNVAAPTVVSPETVAAKGRDGTAASLVATVKGLSPKALAALERADAAAGLSAASSAAAVAAATPLTTEPNVTAMLSSPTMSRTGAKMSAPVGSRTAAAEAREEAEARERVLAHERYVQAWLGVMKEFRERRSAEATT
ncbi:hypothetical protein Vafri_8512, partial [Volvox africanus]